MALILLLNLALTIVVWALVAAIMVVGFRLAGGDDGGDGQEPVRRAPKRPPPPPPPHSP